MTRSILCLASLAATLTAGAALAQPSPFSPEETAAIYRGAGFKVQGNTVIGCDAEDPGWPRSQFFIEAVDLDGDGRPEAIAIEGNVACYGGTGQAFTILARNPDGSWRALATQWGVPMPASTRHRGWLDIEFGGPGMQAPRRLRWDGKVYR